MRTILRRAICECPALISSTLSSGRWMTKLPHLGSEPTRVALQTSPRSSMHRQRHYCVSTKRTHLAPQTIIVVARRVIESLIECTVDFAALPSSFSLSSFNNRSTPSSFYRRPAPLTMSGDFNYLYQPHFRVMKLPRWVLYVLSNPLG